MKRKESCLMLTEIYSEAFRYGNGKERGPIPLHQGMNIVLGIDRDCNSVGKSSFLLAIDFAFGGTIYPTKEIKDQLDDHRICWKMEFGIEEYWFCRWTSSKDKVERCDKDYHERILEQPMAIDEYISFLYDKLKMTTDEREYQILTSVFMRIHPKPSNIARVLPTVNRGIGNAKFFRQFGLGQKRFFPNMLDQRSIIHKEILAEFMRILGKKRRFFDTCATLFFPRTTAFARRGRRF